MALEGKRVTLREQREEDIAIDLGLRNDLATQGWNLAIPPDFTEPMIRKRWEERKFSYDPDFGKFMVDDRVTGSTVGFVSYSFGERRHTAMLGIAVVRGFWGKGHAFEACDLLLDFMFRELGLQVATWWTTGLNERSIGLALKLGFIEAARMRESAFMRGKLSETVVLDILREEWFERHPDLSDELTLS